MKIQILQRQEAKRNVQEMKTIIITILAVMIGVILHLLRYRFSGMNPILFNPILGIMWSFLMIIIYLIVKENSWKNRIIQIGILIAAIMISNFYTKKQIEPYKDNVRRYYKYKK